MKIVEKQLEDIFAGSIRRAKMSDVPLAKIFSS